MSIAKQISNAEAVADVSLISALRDISDQLGQAAEEEVRWIPIRAVCPGVLEALMRIATGRIPTEQAPAALARGLVTDKADLMNTVIEFEKEFSPDGLGVNTQRVALTDGVGWNDLQSLVEEGASFITQR